MRKLLIISLLAALGFFIAPSSAQEENYTIKSIGLDLSITSTNLIQTQVVGESSVRGAALAILENGDYLIGGGREGNTIFLYQKSNKKLTSLGTVFSKSLRPNDARFAITDLLPLSTNSNLALVLVSYPRLGENKNCVQLQVDLVAVDLNSKSVKTQETWFTSEPCVPISAVQHAAGRLERIDQASAYLTVGDFGFSEIANRKISGDLSSIFKISKNRIEKISSGHRNAQGILLFKDRYLLASEHGPRGGDEINFIKPGADYGWPLVTYGEAYSSGDYVVPRKTATHEGYEKPMMYWVPSIAPTELIQLPINSNWQRWSGQILMGTLREESLVRIYIDNEFRPIAQDFIRVNERIRDLEVSSDGVVVATTDSGKILEITPVK